MRIPPTLRPPRFQAMGDGAELLLIALAACVRGTAVRIDEEGVRRIGVRTLPRRRAADPAAQRRDPLDGAGLAKGGA